MLGTNTSKAVSVAPHHTSKLGATSSSATAAGDDDLENLADDALNDSIDNNNENTNGINLNKQIPGTPMTVDSATTSGSLSCSRAALTVEIPSGHAYATYATASPRYPLPSPSRSRLDSQYARRLASSLSVSSTTSADSSVETVRQKSFSASDILPPPSVNRHRHIFDLSTPRSSSLTTSSPRYGSLSTTAASQKRTSLLLRQSSSPSSFSLDRGTTDRFIPSRVTSSMDLDLWGSRYERQNYFNTDGDDSNTSNGNANNSNTNNDGNTTNNNTATAGANNANNADQADSSSNSSNGSGNNGTSNGNGSQSQSSTMHNALLRSELLGENPGRMRWDSGNTGNNVPIRDAVNQFRYTSARQRYQENVLPSSDMINSFSLTPVGNATSQHLLSALPQKRKRRIAKIPFKVLDAPALQDDFYLNLVDWSAQNVLAVGLGSCVYLWSACTSKVTKLCDLTSQNNDDDVVTSVSWADRGNHLAVGTNRGEVQVWDCVKVKRMRTMNGHTNRVGTLAWNGSTLASGSRDRMIYLRDVRMQAPYTHCLRSHKQEVCGLKWSFDDPGFLASGGNDNQLYVVDSRNPTSPLHNFTDHSAAVKAIAWSPHQHGLLASGGGTADRCIRFWNTLSGTNLNCVDTGSQVCNLAWSKNCNEIVSTHGYSLNQIVLWRYPGMSKVATLTGHSYRVLYLAMSPDGSTIVTGAGDETLRFWQVFPGPRSDGKNSDGGLLFPSTLGSVVR